VNSRSRMRSGVRCQSAPDGKGRRGDKAGKRGMRGQREGGPHAPTETHPAEGKAWWGRAHTRARGLWRGSGIIGAGRPRGRGLCLSCHGPAWLCNGDTWRGLCAPWVSLHGMDACADRGMNAGHAGRKGAGSKAPGRKQACNGPGCGLRGRLAEQRAPAWLRRGRRCGTFQNLHLVTLGCFEKETVPNCVALAALTSNCTQRESKKGAAYQNLRKGRWGQGWVRGKGAR
jgi:hypothetical protein